MNAAKRYIISCSFGKDSLATILLAKKHGEPLDEAVYCEVMFDKTISGEVPEHRDFIYTRGIPALERMGIKVTVLRGERTYLDLFTGRITRGPKKGMLRSFPICGRCAVQRDCKSGDIRKACRLTQSSISALPRTSRNASYDLGGTRYPFWRNTTAQNRMPGSSARKRGSFLLSTPLLTGEAAGSAPTPSAGSCAISMTTTRSCGPGCWSCRPCQARQQRNSTALSGFQILTRRFGRRTSSWIYSEKLRKRGDDNDDQSEICNHRDRP